MSSEKNAGSGNQNFIPFFFFPQGEIIFPVAKRKKKMISIS